LPQRAVFFSAPASPADLDVTAADARPSGGPVVVDESFVRSSFPRAIQDEARHRRRA
jgi:hypothetical protein